MWQFECGAYHVLMYLLNDLNEGFVATLFTSNERTSGQTNKKKKEKNECNSSVVNEKKLYVLYAH